jgi:aspartyl/asparaginyl beta-hydroxylase (cupin superfamily)
MINSKVRFLYSDFAKYESDEPVLYDLSTHPAVIDLKRNFSKIVEEMRPYMMGEVKVNTNNPNAPNINYPDTWKHLYFMNYMLEYPAGRKLFPFTYSILKSHPEITLAGIASLEGGGRLFPHSGETNAIIRCHLGLKIPGKIPECGIRVKDQHISWVEGDVISFNDAFNHEAWNLTKEKRYVLLFDVMRPEFIKQQKEICAYALSIASIRFVAEKLKIDEHLPLFVRKLAIAPTYMFWCIFLTIQNIWFDKPRKVTR